MSSIIDETYTNLGGEGVAKMFPFAFSRSDGNRISVLDTPGLWDKSPGDNSYWLPIGQALSDSCRKLLQEIESLVGSARSFLDITTLWHMDNKLGGFPDVWFLQALQKGFAQIAASRASPTIRILIGIPLGPIVSVQDLANWVNKLIPSDTELTVHIATNHTSALNSWNHSKIIAADGKSAIVGGHNLWSSAYMSFAPVHDVSVRVDGPAAIAAHAFANILWEKPFDCIKWYKRRSENGVRPASAMLPTPPSAGSTRILSVGRMGTGISNVTNKLTDASVYARLTAILRAKSDIRISQQGLGFQFIQSDITSFDVPTMAALTKAMLTGVKVSIVMSNDGAKDAAGDRYSSTSVAITFEYFIRFIQLGLHTKYLPPKDAGPDKYYELTTSKTMAEMWAEVLSLSPDRHSTVEVAQILNSQLFLTTLQFSKEGGNWRWMDGKKSEERIPGNHAKVYIIDDTNFYIGSDNMYRSSSKGGLQEFGYMFEGKEETQDFIRNYWDKLWMYSKTRRFGGAPIL